MGKGYIQGIMTKMDKEGLKELNNKDFSLLLCQVPPIYRCVDTEKAAIVAEFLM